MVDDSRVSSYYSGFRTDIFETEKNPEGENSENKSSWMVFKEQDSIFDQECANCPAQYATSKETPTQPWDEVTTKLSELDTSKVHYVKVPENHIVIDFDLKGDDGKKSFEKNYSKYDCNQLLQEYLKEKHPEKSSLYLSWRC